MEQSTQAGIHTIDSHRAGPHVLVSAGVHGDEFEPVLAATALIDELKQVITAGKVTVVPVVNTTAFAAGSRYGEDGLDLARVCPGNPEGSATQRDAACISGLIRLADYYIDLHTGGALFEIFPLAGYMLHSNPEVLHKQREMASAFGLPVVWGTENAPEGRTLSVARDAGVPAIYTEYGGGGMLNKEVITAYRQGVLQVLQHLNMVAASGKPYTPEYWVEDAMPNSGYLQGKLPAPGGGIFVSEKVPGNMVLAGEKIGAVFNPLTRKEMLVAADMDGFLLFIRTASLVKEGNALGGILPITKPGKVTLHAR